MKHRKIVFFQENDTSVPSLEWLRSLKPKAQVKCLAKIKRLRDVGHELRRPEADYLRDGIYELRIGLEGLNYRLLYFFHGQEVAVLSHGVIKKRIVPLKEIDIAIRRKKDFENNPNKHTFISEV